MLSSFWSFSTVFSLTLASSRADGVLAFIRVLLSVVQDSFTFRCGLGVSYTLNSSSLVLSSAAFTLSEAVQSVSHFADRAIPFSFLLEALLFQFS